MNESDKYCNNCGVCGHLYKDCKYPIMSYGHILFNRITNKILMIQRKDSLCYIEFIRGKYDIYNLRYIQILINKFTLEEKANVIKCDYDELWRKLWLVDDEFCESKYKLKNDYIKGKEKFEKLKKGYLFRKMNCNIHLSYFVDNSNTGYTMSEWEFPKGRRNNGESNKECAQREFEEETNYSSTDYEIIENMSPFSEEYMGENKIKYKHIYYIGYLTNYEKKVIIDYENEDQYTEIKDIQWLTKEESLLKLRNYHYTRKRVIEDIFNFMDNLEKDYCIV